MADEEDVALSALKSFFRAAEWGRFPDLSDRNGLWRLLSEMTRRKAVDHIRRELAQRHGGGQVQDESDFDTFISGDPTPDVAVMLTENCQHMLDKLPPDVRTLALLKLEGFNNEEVAAQLGCGLRTVERRRLQLIRKTWEQESNS